MLEPSIKKYRKNENVFIDPRNVLLFDVDLKKNPTIYQCEYLPFN